MAEAQVKSRVFTPRAPTVYWGENKHISSQCAGVQDATQAEGASGTESREVSLEKTLEA